MNISVVIVSWNVRELLRRAIASVEAEAASMPESHIDIIVVDNNSQDGTVAMIEQSFPSVQVITNHDNRGFGAACNQAFPLCTGDAVILLNPDASLQPGSLRTLAGFLESHPDVGTVGPKLLNSDGSTQSSRRRFPTVTTAFLESTILQTYFPNNRHLQRFYCLDKSDDVEQEVDWLVGACLLIRRTTLDEVGGLDERFFMYFEEVDWFLRAHRLGWKTAYVPTAQTLHHYGQSSVQNLRQRHVRFTESKYQYYVKNFGQAIGWLVRSFLLASYAWQLLLETLKLALHHKPDLRRERIALLTGVLKWGILG